MSKRAVPSRHDWLPSALPVLFGAEPEPVDPWPRLMDVSTQCRVSVAEVWVEASRVAEKVGALGGHLPPLLPESVAAKDDAGVRDTPMRVVMTGRTMAGKSSLLAAMTGSHHDRIGDGRQRYSRDVFGAPTAMSDRIQLVDTPGVGAHGGADDTEIALEAALDADVVLWVNSSDSIQQESAAALKLLGVIGKPIIVVLNCGQVLEGIGRLNLLRFPERIFGGKEGLLDEVGRHMAEAGVSPLAVVRVHALAAAEATAGETFDVELHRASRIDDLAGALLREHDTHSESRRALRLVDQPRQRAEALAGYLRVGAASLHARAERDRALTADLHDRLDRSVRTKKEEMEADVVAAVGRHRDWHLTATDFGKSLQSDWKDAVAALQSELDRDLAVRTAHLADEIESTVADVDAEWSKVEHEQFRLRDLAGFDTVWGNRLARAGIGVGGSALGVSGGAWLGAQIGGALGLAGGPAAIMTAGVGLMVGGIAGLAAGQVKNLVDHVFLGKDGVLRKRRAEVARQVGPILDDLTTAYVTVIDAHLEQVRGALARERGLSDERSSVLDRTASAWTGGVAKLRLTIGEVDRETASALLRINRRERLAASVVRATRVPGVCILAELDESAFWEAWLFPPDTGEAFAGGRAPASAGEGAGALSYALGLVDAPVRLVRSSSATTQLSIGADIPSAIAQTWANALEAHVGSHIQIDTTRRTRGQ